MNTITREEAAALLEAATPGPWRRDSLDVLPSRIPSEGWLIAACGTSDSPDAAPYNAALIAAAPSLAHTVVALHDRIAELEATLAAERGDPAGALPGWEPNGEAMRAADAAVTP